jgi:hypothetical protein
MYGSTTPRLNGTFKRRRATCPFVGDVPRRSIRGGSTDDRQATGAAALGVDGVADVTGGGQGIDRVLQRVQERQGGRIEVLGGHEPVEGAVGIERRRRHLRGVATGPVHDDDRVLTADVRLGDEPPARHLVPGDPILGELGEHGMAGLVLIGEFRQGEQLGALWAGEDDRGRDGTTVLAHQIVSGLLTHEPELFELHGFAFRMDRKPYATGRIGR